jgi:tRNA nucleotidyltransferase (CCA-adding enzyme)
VAVVQAHPLLRRVPDFATDPVSLVGGAVRDAYLDVPHAYDIDLVVEGDALDFARRIGHALNVRVDTHERFGTAEIQMAHEAWIDIAMARSETYPEPGALPAVTRGTLEDDLRRRDFTVNAVAYRLSGAEAGSIVDPCGGVADIDAGILRTLHPQSFIDDPSRLIRLARYAARFAFHIDGDTAAAARLAAATLDPRSSRVADELRRLLCEPQSIPALQLLHTLGVPWILPCVTSGAAVFQAVDRALSAPGAPAVPAWAIRLGLVVDPAQVGHVAVDGWARGVAGEVADADALVEALRQAPTRSEVDLLLRRVRPATAVVARAFGADLVEGWWAHDRDLRLAIGGADLVAAGMRPGPSLGRALTATRRGVLDGEVDGSRDAQLAFALAHQDDR